MNFIFSIFFSLIINKVTFMNEKIKVEHNFKKMSIQEIFEYVDAEARRRLELKA